MLRCLGLGCREAGSARSGAQKAAGEPEERLLEETSNTGERAWGRLFDEILGAARFEIERDGEAAQVSEEEVLALLYDPDRATRRAAAESLTGSADRGAGALRG